LALATEDDGFREIQLSGKQLVFLFMALTVVSVVIFLTGVLVGRGVRVERTDATQVEALADPPVSPVGRAPIATPDDADPRKAAPPAPIEGESDAKADAKRQIADEPPVAIKRSPLPEVPVAAVARPANIPQPVVAQAAPASKPAAAAASAAAASDVDAPARTGYAVQVAATNARGEADAIAKRLSAKGYSAYVDLPKGSTTVFRVRVGSFKTRRDAQTVADRLKKEEKFKPWVTR
jgi:septal ring-binding cell division protein DamX